MVRGGPLLLENARGRGRGHNSRGCAGGAVMAFVVVVAPRAAGKESQLPDVKNSLST